MAKLTGKHFIAVRIVNHPYVHGSFVGEGNRHHAGRSSMYKISRAIDWIYVHKTSTHTHIKNMNLGIREQDVSWFVVVEALEACNNANNSGKI